jgi:adiponectin receptor
MSVQTQLSMTHAAMLVTQVKEVETDLQHHKIGNEKRHATVVKTVKAALLSIDKVPEWYGENPFILSGYRPVFDAVTPCFSSWFYLHNQTGNIFTHLIPGLLSLVLNGAFGRWFGHHYPDASLADRAVFHVYLTACALCFGVSATYHTMLCHSRDLADLWIRLDYVSISILILGSFVPQLYVTFNCEPILLRTYLFMVCCVVSLRAHALTTTTTV